MRNSQFLEQLAKDTSKCSDPKLTREEAFNTGKCVQCGGDATEFRDDLSAKEYTLTVWCQKCQDNFFGV